MSNNHHYQVVSDAIEYLTEYVHEQPSLSVLAKQLGLSETHLQKVFSEWVGISPKTLYAGFVEGNSGSSPETGAKYLGRRRNGRAVWLGAVI